MWLRPTLVRAPAEARGSGQVLSVAVLEEDGPDRLTHMLGERVDLKLHLVPTLEALIGLIAGGAVDAAVVDPELAEGWPADIALRLGHQVSQRVPVVLVCRSERDATVIEGRATNVSVLVRDQIDAEALVAVLKGQLARRRAS